MPQLDSDAFTYSNGNLATVSSAKWTKLSGFTDLVVASNALKGSAGNDCADVIASWSGSNTDHYSQVTIGTLAADGGPTLRASAVDDFYLLDIPASGACLFFKTVDGSFTEIATTAITWANGDLAYAEVQGTTIITKQNGTTRHNFTDSAIASGKPGIFVSGGSLILDDWVAGDFAAAAGGSVSQAMALLGVQ